MQILGVVLRLGNCMEVQNMFSGKAENYSISRPSYPKEIIDCLYNKHGFSKGATVADIGAGTGKFSKLLLERGTKVYCIEPNADMLAVAKKELSHFNECSLLCGLAESTGLKDCSVDFVTVAQAFHWFNIKNFKSECLRILKPGGKVVLVWNERSLNAKVNEEWSGVFSRYCKNFVGFGNGMTSNSDKIKSFYGGDFTTEVKNFPLVFDRQGFIKRSLSASYSLTQNDKEYLPYINALNNLFDKFQQDEKIIIPNDCICFVGQLN